MCRIRTQSSRETFWYLCIYLIRGLFFENKTFWKTKQVIMYKLDCWEPIASVLEPTRRWWQNSGVRQ